MRKFCCAAILWVASIHAGADTGDIETIVVRAARVPLPTAQVGSSTSVLSQADFLNRQVLSVADVLRSVPGIAVSRAGGTGTQTQLRMRGGEGNHVLVVIDGVVVNDPALGNEYDFAHLLNYDLESIEVIRGPQSALWGSDALSGVINITSRASDGLEVFAEGGSDQYRRFGGTAAHAGDRLSARISAYRIQTDGENISREGDEDDGYENTTAKFGMGYAFSSDFHLDGSFMYTDATTQFDGVDFSTGLPTDQDNEGDVEQIYARITATLDTLDGRWNHRLSFNLTDTKNSSETSSSLSAATVNHYIYQTSFALNDAHTLTGAFERQEQDYKQRGLVTFADPNRDENLDWSAWIGEYRGDITPELSLLASARRDQNSDFDDATTGRLSGAWRLNDGKTKLRAAYGTGIKNPTFTERFGFFNNFIGNPDLEPEKSKGWEVGLDQILLDGRIDVSLTWFDESLRDEINGFVFEPVSGGFTADNGTGKSKREGLEIDGGWQITDALRLQLAYTWLDATELDNGDRVDEVRRANQIANANLHWQPNSAISLNINVDYNGKQDDFFFPPTPPFKERVQLDDFILVAIAGSYQFSESLSVFARIENLFDEDYEEVLGFSTPGRSAFIGLRYRLNN